MLNVLYSLNPLLMQNLKLLMQLLMQNLKLLPTLEVHVVQCPLDVAHVRHYHLEYGSQQKAVKNCNRCKWIAHRRAWAARCTFEVARGTETSQTRLASLALVVCCATGSMALVQSFEVGYGAKNVIQLEDLVRHCNHSKRQASGEVPKSKSHSEAQKALSAEPDADAMCM